MSVIVNASTSTGLGITSDNSGSVEIQSNGTTKLTVQTSGVSGTITTATAQASTSGTQINFTHIPSWAKRITVMFNGVSTNGTSNYLLQIGSGSIETSGYLSHVIAVQSAASSSGGNTNTSGLQLTVSITAASDLYNGHIVLTNMGSNLWISSHNVGNTAATRQNIGSGSKTTVGSLDLLRITTVNGTDTFDAGSINIMYEG